MNKIDEMELLMRFRAAVAPPGADTLSRARARMLSSGDPGRLPRRTRFWLAAAGATVALAAVAAGAVALSGAPSQRPRTAAQLTAATVLQRAARASLAAPSPGANHFLHTVTITKDPQNAVKEWVTREWTSVTKGSQRIAQVPSCNSVFGGGFEHDQGCWLSPFIMDVLPFTYTGLERLPTSARALLGYLNAEQYQACGVLGKRMNQAEREWSGVFTILNNVPVLPPRFGAALFDAAAQIPGVRVIRDIRTAAGQPGIAVARAMPVKGAAFVVRQAELIFSPRTYRYVGNVLDGDFTGGTRQSSALITAEFTSTYPHYLRPGYAFPVPGCIGQVSSSGS